MNKKYDNSEDARTERLWKKLTEEKGIGKDKIDYDFEGFRTTLDIDSTEKDFIMHIVRKIIRCKFNKRLEFEWSSFKGCHFTVFCIKECDKCRLVFDDFRRLAYDENRPRYARNILFSGGKEKLRLENGKI